MSSVAHSRLRAETVEYGGSMLREAGIPNFATITRAGVRLTELQVGELPGTLPLI